MRRIEKLARKTYGRHLDDDEEVSAVVAAIAAGTGRTIGVGFVIGALGGVLYATLLEGTAPLPAIVLGSFIGIIGGYAVAERRARGRHGPGATQVRVVLTTKRLLLFRLQPALKDRPLRTFRRDEIVSIETSAAAIGSYRRSRIELSTGTTLRLLTAGPLDFAATDRKQKGGEGVD